MVGTGFKPVLLPDLLNYRHLVSSLEKLVRHGANRGAESLTTEHCKRRAEVRRDLAVQIEQREYADFSCDSAKLAQSPKVKRFAQLL